VEDEARPETTRENHEIHAHFVAAVRHHRVQRQRDEPLRQPTIVSHRADVLVQTHGACHQCHRQSSQLVKNSGNVAQQTHTHTHTQVSGSAVKIS